MRGEALDLVHPIIPDLLEGLFGRDVVDHDHGVRVFVVGASDRPESLLAGSIPYLEFNHLAVNIDSPEPEVYTNCC